MKLAQLQGHIANQQSGMIYKLSANLVQDYDLITIEDLAAKSMVKNYKLARSISDIG